MAETMGTALTADTNQDDSKVVMPAQFWRSPFAVAAAVAVTFQGIMMTYATLSDKPFDSVISMPLIMVVMMMLAAGVFPAWNFIAIDDDGFEQHAGLTGVKTDWKKVQNVRVFANWVEIRHVHGDTPGEKKVRTIRLLNRYGMSAEKFGTMIEERWRTARGLEF
jgi:hypothetical protein